MVLLTDNLISCYLFGATVTADNEGNYNLTNSGVTSDSSTTKVEATSGFWNSTDNMQQAAAATNSLNAITIAFWAKGTGTGTQYNFFAKNAAAFRAQMNYGPPPTGTYFTVNGEASANTGSGVYTVTNWNHFIFMEDGTNKYIVVNGVVKAKVACTNDTPSSGNLYIGQNSVNTTETFGGNFSQFAVWNAALDGIAGLSVGNSVTGLAASLYNSGSGLARSSWGAVSTNMQINIGDTWHVVAAAQVNIGDVWHPVAGMKINIGDTWHTIF